MIRRRVNPNLLMITFAILTTTTFFFLSSAVLRSANTFGRRCLPELDEYFDDTLKSNLKIAIVSFSDEKKAPRGRSFEGLMKLVGVNKRNYAQKMGYDFVDGKWLVDRSRPPNWSKILAINFYLDSYDWVFWNDADTVITNPDISLESILMAAIGHLDFHASPDLLVTEDVGGVNAGVFFIRRSKWSKEFLDKWWNETSFIKFGSTKSGDNAAMKHLINNLCLEDLQSHVMISPMQCLFNSYPWNPTWKSLYRLLSSPQTIWKGTYSRGDFMVHFAGLDNKREWATKVLLGIKR